MWSGILYDGVLNEEDLKRSVRLRPIKCVRLYV